MKKIDYKYLIKDERNYFLFFILVLSAYCVYNLFRLPVMVGDTDLWYHLNGGRYFFDHYTIPHDSFFSFMVPARKWVDYYWLFQVFVYKIYQYSGYYGLIWLRAFLLMGLMFFILRYFSRNMYERKSYFVISMIFSLYLLFFLPRYTLIRPHMFSYFFIVLFIYILEYRPTKAFILPLLALLWVNVHGIVYPVMLLIALAYLSEFAIKRIIVREEIGKEGFRVIIPLVLVLFTVYCTPHGIRLIGIPATPIDFASHYILELKQLSFVELSSLHFIKFIPTTVTVFVMVLILACFACIHVMLIPQRRISHLILFAGALALLIRSGRFAFEFVLLAMPVMKDALFFNSVFTPFNKNKKIPLVKVVFMCLLSTIPLYCLQNGSRNLPRFPVSYAHLPHGVTTFLQKIDAGGAVLNYPAMGGYLQWALYPKYKIFMDMEAPFLFTDEDMYVAMKVFDDDQIFNKVLRQYNPSFISVPIIITTFPGLISKYPQYKPVFFDDSEVLYINELHYPLIARTYLLKYIDPFSFSKIIPELKNYPKIDALAAELERMYRIDPDCSIINRGLSTVSRQKGDYKKAVTHADAIIRNYPESHLGYLYKGNALKDSHQYTEALENFKNALKRAEGMVVLHRAVGLIYFEQKQYRKAYDALIRAADLYSTDISYKDLYYIIYSAAGANLRKKATLLFQYAVKMLPPDDKEWNKKYEELQSILVANSKK